jgi:hypothetical protein
VAANRALGRRADQTCWSGGGSGLDADCPARWVIAACRFTERKRAANCAPAVGVWRAKVLLRYWTLGKLSPLVVPAVAKAHLLSESANSELRAVMVGLRCPIARISGVVGTPAIAGESPK